MNGCVGQSLSRFKDLKESVSFFLVYEWLCGTVPFKGTKVQIEKQHEFDLPRPLSTYISIAPPVEEVILKALAKEPEQRFQSVQEFAQTLEKVYLEQMSVFLKQSELTADVLRQE